MEVGDIVYWEMNNFINRALYLEKVNDEFSRVILFEHRDMQTYRNMLVLTKLLKK